MFDVLNRIFGGSPVAAFESAVRDTNALEPELQKLNDAEIRERSLALREKVRAAGAPGGFEAKAFALVREAARRTLGQRPYDVQLMGGLAMNQGAVVEMMTGEGKTLAAIGPAYLNALLGKGVHVVTVNEYLARRDAVWMGRIYRFLGLSVSCLVPQNAFLYDPDYVMEHGARDMEQGVSGERKEKELEKKEAETGSFLVQQDFLRPVSRREAYLADVTYGTNHEFGFDYLRDNLAYRLEDQVQRGHNYVIIDEVDSILIDEARTPLIIAAPDAQSSDSYKVFAKVAERLTAGEDFEVDEKKRAVSILPAGIEKVEKAVGVENLYAPENLRMVHYLEESLKAKNLFRRDKDYVVKDGQVIIVDEFTGRMLHGRRYNGGLHQAIEAKEGVRVQEESKTYAKISIQNYFRQYKKIAGMTGTAQTSAEEFHKVYGLEVVPIPPNRKLARKDGQDLIYKNRDAKWRAIIADIKARHEKGQPILIGTTSIEKNELASSLLLKAGIPHEILNAKNNEREGAIIAQAGRTGAVTVATNMAGRGVDIILGGNPPDPAEAEKVREAGGLHVVGTERHEARRIDNQLRGRAGRQGDPGSSQFFLSLDDDLMRIFGGERIQNMMEKFDLPEDVPIQVGFVSKSVAQAQAKVEGFNFDLRKHLLEYDDVLNKQRTAVYKKRQAVLTAQKEGKLAEMLFETAAANLDRLLAADAPEEELKKAFAEAGITDQSHPWPTEGDLRTNLRALLTRRSVERAPDPRTPMQILSIVDLLWLNHLEDLDALSESVGLRAYGQKDPLVEYRQEAHRLHGAFGANFDALVFGNAFRPQPEGQTQTAQPAANITPRAAEGEKVGRNDPCPCGSGKKYKKCHGK